MTLALPRDEALPGLAALAQADLDRITGTTGARLLRARYQPGARAILHVALGPGPGAPEGVVWFFAGRKAERLAGGQPGARFDPRSGALFEAFPQDHRMPRLARIMAEAQLLSPRLIGSPAAAPPDLLRYRPGLSATFRWRGQDGRVAYAKHMPDDDVLARRDMLARLPAATSGQPLAVTPVLGVIPDLGLIAYARAAGRPLDQILAGGTAAQAGQAIAQVLRGLDALGSLDLRPTRRADRAALLRRAGQAAQMIALLDGPAGQAAAQLVAGLEAQPVTPRCLPIHGDMKPDHAFLDGPVTTLIDMESLALGDPDEDLAMLDAGIDLARRLGQITPCVAAAARAAIAPRRGPDHGWFLTCARLHGARFFAQRLDPAQIPAMRQMLHLP